MCLMCTFFLSCVALCIIIIHMFIVLKSIYSWYTSLITLCEVRHTVSRCWCLVDSNGSSLTAHFQRTMIMLSNTMNLKAIASSKRDATHTRSGNTACNAIERRARLNFPAATVQLHA